GKYLSLDIARRSHLGCRYTSSRCRGTKVSAGGSRRPSAGMHAACRLYGHRQRSTEGLRGESMTFDEVLDHVRELLQQRGRVTYRSLKRRFALDDEYVEDLKGELIKAEGVAADEDGEVLVWTGSITPG